MDEIAPLAERVLDVTSFGAVANDGDDDTDAVQLALAAARRFSPAVVYFPAGVYDLRPGDDGAGLRIASHTHLRGDGPRSVIRVASGVGSYESLLTSFPVATSPVTDIALSDLRFDQNCAQSGGEVRGGGATKHRFAILLMYSASNIHIRRVVFDPVCGVNTVDINGPNVRNVSLEKCSFRFVRGPTSPLATDYDNSAVYLHGTALAVTRCAFDTTFADGGRGAIELHGSGTASDNVSRQYRSCVRIASGAPDDGWDVRPKLAVLRNRCFDTSDAINAWAMTGQALTDAYIADNVITVAGRAHGLSAARGISLTWDSVSGQVEGDYARILIERNQVTFRRDHFAPRATSGLQTSGGVLLQSQGNIDRVTVRGNVIRDSPSHCIRIEARRGGSLASHILIDSNVLAGCGLSSTAGSNSTGIAVSGSVRNVEIVDNTIRVGAGPSPTQAIRVSIGIDRGQVVMRRNRLGRYNPQ